MADSERVDTIRDYAAEALKDSRKKQEEFIREIVRDEMEIRFELIANSLAKRIKARLLQILLPMTAEERARSHEAFKLSLKADLENYRQAQESQQKQE